MIKINVFKLAKSLVKRYKFNCHNTYLLLVVLFTFSLNTLFLLNVSANSTEFSYTGGEQIFNPPQEGIYLIELWGAQGGDDGSGIGGRGGYASGEISLSQDDSLRVRVGGQGVRGPSGNAGVFQGGYNGGGAGYASDGYLHASGGGASDVLLDGNQIIVAGGGGGGDDYGSSQGGDGGGLTGEAGTTSIMFASPGGGGTQNSGGSSSGNATAGSFGNGGNSSTGTLNGGSGGGGGYYGGGGGHTAAGGGGSSFIGGVDNGSTTAGQRAGDGLARITFLGESPPWEDVPGDEIEDVEEEELLINIPDIDSRIYKTDDPDVRFFKIPDDLIVDLREDYNNLIINTPHFEVFIPHRIFRDLHTNPNGYKMFMGCTEQTVEKDEIIAQMLVDDPDVLNYSNIYNFGLFSAEDEDSNAVDTISEFSEPMQIKLKNVGDKDGLEFNNVNETAVFYVEPEYDNDVLISAHSFFTGNADYGRDITFLTDHFSFFVVKYRDGFYFTDQGAVNDSYARREIEKLSSLKILSGDPSGNFNPSNQMQRTHFSIALNNTLGKIGTEYEAGLYNDVLPSDYFAGPIARLHSHRIPDTFNPVGDPFGVYVDPNDHSQGRRNITRIEAAVFMSNSYEYLSRLIPNLSQRAPRDINYQDIDNSMPKQEREAVSIVTQTGVMQGWDDDYGQRNFNPNEPLTREMAAIILYNFQRIYNRGLTFNADVN